MIEALYEKFKQLKIDETREVSDDYLELVFYSDDLAMWHEVLKDAFGQPHKPVGEKPTKEISKITKQFGGVFGNQTFYMKKDGGQNIGAMLWPWQDDEHITLKVFSFSE